jgi:NADPH-dependent 2,4-dienoyl-CoA reductase/sulfur reductase-like enzyme
VTRAILVVGGGPAGMAAAIEASQRGCRVMLVDEAVRPGGQIYRQADPALQVAEHAEATELLRKHRLLERFHAALPRIDYRAGTSVYAIFPNGEAHFAKDERTEVVRPDAIVLATGVRELAIPFPGWTIPGVMFAGGAQAMLKSQGVLPGRKAVIAGCGPLPIVVAAQLARAGVEIRGLASLRPLASMLRSPSALWHGREALREGIRYARTVRRQGVPLMTGSVPVRAIGKDRLEAVVLARVDAAGCVVARTEREIGCDLLAVNYGFVANSELAAMAGARMRYRPVMGGWLPEVDEVGRTSVPGLFAAGDGAGLRGAFVAESEGSIVGAAAALPVDAANDSLPGDARLAEAHARRRRHLAFQAALRATLDLPRELWRLVTDETIVCRCESVRFGEIRSALDNGHRSLNAVKRNVRVGMGWCAGRTCLHAVAALTELHTGAAPTEMMTPRPLVRPVSFAALARQERGVAQ